MASPHPLSHRARYTPAQLQTYLTHLHRNIPSANPHSHPLSTLSTLHSTLLSSSLSTLTALMKLHLSSVPWGSLALHYSPHHTLPLSPPSHLFHKLITRNLGGYCMEQNIFFSHILRSLGFSVYLSGARVSLVQGASSTKSQSLEERDGWGAWEHCVIFVTINDAKYLVDVGFGGGNAIEPILMEEREKRGREAVEVNSRPGMKGRVVKRKLAGSERPDGGDEMWVYQNRVTNPPAGEPSEPADTIPTPQSEANTTGGHPSTPQAKALAEAARQREIDVQQGWSNAYAFTETEWFENDFVTSNYKTSRSQLSWFTFTFVLTRMVLRGESAAGTGRGEVGNEEGGDRRDEDTDVETATTLSGGSGAGRDGAGNEFGLEVVGSVTLVGGKLTRRLGWGESEVLKECKSEAERVAVLRGWFGVELNEEEVEGIRGMVTELKG